MTDQTINEPDLLGFDTVEGILNLAKAGLIPAKFRYEDKDLKRAWQAGDIPTDEDYRVIVEDHQRWKVLQIQAAVAWGAEIGFSPATALSYIQFIKGNPSLSAEGMRDKALEHGHEIVIVEASSEIAIVEGRRGGSDRWSRITWTMADAKTAGLLSGGQWGKYPMAMLIFAGDVAVVPGCVPGHDQGVLVYAGGDVGDRGCGRTEACATRGSAEAGNGSQAPRQGAGAGPKSGEVVAILCARGQGCTVVRRGD